MTTLHKNLFTWISKTIQSKSSIFSETAHTDGIPEELLSDQFIQFDDIHVISAKHKKGIEEVKTSIRETLDKYAESKLNDSSDNFAPSDRKLVQEST